MVCHSFIFPAWNCNETVNRYKFGRRFVYDALKSFRSCVIKVLRYRRFIRQENFFKVVFFLTVIYNYCQRSIRYRLGTTFFSSS